MVPEKQSPFSATPAEKANGNLIVILCLIIGEPASPLHGEGNILRIRVINLFHFSLFYYYFCGELILCS